MATNTTSLILGILGGLVHSGGQDIENLVEGKDGGSGFEKVLAENGIPYVAGDLIDEACRFTDSELTKLATIPDSVLVHFAVEGCDMETAKHLRDAIASACGDIPLLVQTLRTVKPVAAQGQTG